MIHSLDILNISSIILGVLVVLLIAEILKRKFNVSIEYTRKIAHILVGILVLAFPILFDSHYIVLFLAISFLILLAISRTYHFLDSINGIRRRSLGSLLYPLSVYFCFFIYSQTGSVIYYYLPMSLFIFCDPVGAIVGIRTNWIPYKTFFQGTKTLGGSLAFFFVAFPISCFLLQLNVVPDKQFIWHAILIAASATIVEGLSPLGIDNFTVPLITTLLLYFLNI